MCAKLKAAIMLQMTFNLTRAWQQARSTVRKLAPAPNPMISVAWNKKRLRLQPMPFAAGTTGLVYQGWELLRPGKQRAVKVSTA